jgi:hypothetical protein
MGSSPTPPAVTDPNVTASNQQSLNTQSGIQSQKGSMVNQVTPTGSLSYNQTGTASDGTPLYTATTSLSPEQQQLYNILTGTKNTAGTQASNLLTGANYGSVSPATAIGDATSGLTQQAMGKEVSYLNPYFTQQHDQLDTQLRNQGFAPGQPGYDNAMRALQNNQGNTVTGFEASIEPKMFQQAATTYQMPAQMAESLGQFGSPTAPTFQNTPSLNIQPANLIGATANAQTAQQQTYQDQLAQNNAMMSGMFGIPTAILGGWAKSGGMQDLMSALPLMAA